MFHFYFETPNIADWISVVLTSFGFLLAVYALYHWKKQKEWDVLMDAVAHARSAYTMVSFGYEFDYQNQTENIRFKKVNEYRQQMLGVHSNLEERIRIINTKLNFTFPNKHDDIKEYYTDIVVLIDNLHILQIKQSNRAAIFELEQRGQIQTTEIQELVDKIKKMDFPDKKLSKEEDEALEKRSEKIASFTMPRYWYLF